MAKMKSKIQLAEKDVRKIIRNYWEALESEQDQNESLNRNPVVSKLARLKIKQ